MRDPAQVEELRHPVETLAEEPVVGRPEHDRLREARVRLDEHELAFFAGAPQGGVGGKLREVSGIVGAQLVLARGKRAGHGLDLPKDRLAGRAHDLVDPAREGHDPALPGDLALDGDLELGVGALGDRLRPELVVPPGPQLRAPDPPRAAHRPDWPDREVGEVADAHPDAALVEVESHGMMMSVLDPR